MQVETLGSDFVFPSNLSKMTFEEKEALRVSYARHSAVDGPKPSCELTPSRVMDRNSPEFIARAQRRERAKEQFRNATPDEIAMLDRRGLGMGKFVKGLGFVVDGESATGTRTLTREVLNEVLAKEAEARELQELRRNYANMTNAERDAFDRYGDL